MARKTTPIPESNLLRPLDPSLSNENDWPDFMLTGAEVSDPDSGELESLLLAGPTHPLTLVGKLAKSKRQLQYLLRGKPAQALPATISVSDVEHFCYGLDDDGQAIMWAAGNAGWFRIQPSRSYKAIHKHACEAVTVLYFLADLYAGLKGRKRKSTLVETVFKKYAQDDSHGCSDEAEAVQVFLNHRPFLLDCMTKGKENVNWKHTAIYQFLAGNSSNDEASSNSAVDENPVVQTPRLDYQSDESLRRHAGKSKSSLRPRSSGKYSQKAMGRRIAMDSLGQPEASIEAIQLPLKRKTAGDVDSRPRKRTTLSHEPQDTVMNYASDSESSKNSANELQLPLVTTRQKSAIQAPRIKVIEEPLPSYQPQGPGGNWVCPFDGCSYIVYDAIKPDNQDLIRDHYKEHALDSQAEIDNQAQLDSQSQIDLIYREARPYLPVNNLIKRIRELAAQTDGSDPMEISASLDAGFSKPIRHKWP